MASRNCSYCGKELTDAASKNAGIGPVCRKMQNHVLAQLIPADVMLATYCYKRVSRDTDSIPEVALATLLKIGTDLEKTENKDWRTTCNRVEWLLSFGLPHKTRSTLIDVVASLGYVSLASLLNGEVVKSEATITFEDGRLFLQAKRNKYGNAAIRAIKGRKFHSATKQWSVPAAAHADFKLAVWKHYPKNKGLLEALQAAETYVPPVVETVEETPVKAAPKVVVTKDGKILKIASPYNGAFIAAIKAEISNWKERRWNKTEKVWEVAEAHAAVVTNLVATHYGETVSL